MALTARRKAFAAAAMVGSLLTGGAVGAVLFGPHLAGAQTTTTAPDQGNGSLKSNEDPAHEAGETAEQEAAENNGTFHGGGHRGGGSNEDAAHEAAETPAQEAAEDARRAPSSGAPSTPGPGRPATGTAFRF